MVRRLQVFLEIDELAAIEPERFEEREQVGGIPANRGIHPLNAHLLVEREDLTGQPFADALAHVLRIDAEGGDPGALFDAEPEGEDVADHESDDAAVQFGNKTDVALAAGVFFDQGFEIHVYGFADNGCIDVGDVIGIGGFEFSDPNIFHGNGPLITVAWQG